MDTDKVYVIIVTYNAMKWVDQCFLSLRNSDYYVYPVVVDNGSTDQTVKHIRENYPEVHIIENELNKGFGQANNQGIEYAYKNGASHFFLLNQDAWIHRDTVRKLVNVQNAYNIAVVSPVHLNGDGSTMDYGFFAAAIIQEKNNSFVSHCMFGSLNPYYETTYINAAAWMLSRRCIENVGGFDPIFFHYGEDRNYCQRLLYHKERIVFVPESYIHHDRIYHGNEDVYNKRNTVTKLLITYSNINDSFVHICFARLKIHTMYFAKSSKALLTLQMRKWLNIVSGYCEFFKLITNISYSRKQNVMKAPNWLDL